MDTHLAENLYRAYPAGTLSPLYSNKYDHVNNGEDLRALYALT